MNSDHKGTKNTKAHKEEIKKGHAPMHRLALAIILIIAALGSPAFAIQTNEVELGRDSVYDGSVKLRRDAEGRLTFVDNEVTTPVTLEQLVAGSIVALGNTIVVAATGGQHDNLTDAYAAVPENGVVLVYPGEYAFASQLALGAKGCSFIALDARATTLQIADASETIIVGDAADPVGGENWDTTAPYTQTGDFVFDGFRFASGANAAILVKRANMDEGRLRLSHCRFEGAAAVSVAHDTMDGFSTALHIDVIGCEFFPVDHATREIALSLYSRSRAGAAAAQYRVEDCLFNPAPLAVASPSSSPATYGVGMEMLGSRETALVRGNVFLDVIEPIRMDAIDRARLEADSNTILFRNNLDGFADPRVVGFHIAASGGDASAYLSNNRVRIEDATDAPCETHGLYCDFASATNNSIETRGNEFAVSGADAVADLAESGATLAYALESTDDIWTSEAITVGTLEIGTSGRRKLTQLEIASLAAGAVLYAGSGGLVLGDNPGLHYDDANKGLNIGNAGDTETDIFGSAIPYQLGVHAEGSRDALALLETNSDLHSSGLYLLRSNGSAASKTTVTNGQFLGALAGLGYDGTNYKTAGFINFIAKTPSGGQVPGDIAFFATPGGYAQYIRSDGAVEIVKNLGVGASAFGASADNVIGIADGTAPTSSPAGMVQVFAELTTGTVELQARDEAGNVTTLSPHTFKLYQPADADPLPFSYYSKNPYIGKEINVDVSGAIAEIERISGKKFIHVRDLPADEREDWDSNERANAKSRAEQEKSASGDPSINVSPLLPAAPQPSATASLAAPPRRPPSWILKRLPYRPPATDD